MQQAGLERILTFAITASHGNTPRQEPSKQTGVNTKDRPLNYPDLLRKGKALDSDRQQDSPCTTSLMSSLLKTLKK